jgi:hypothetical protein
MPPLQDVHIDQAQSNFADGVLQEPGNHVAGSFFPITEVDHLSDKYHVLDRNPFMRGDAKPRGSNQESAGFDFTLSQDNFNCVPYAEHTDVDRRKLQNADNPRLLEEAATRLVVDNLLLTYEIDWAARFFAASKWGKDYTGVASGPTGDQFLRWDDANSDPEKDVDRGRREVLITGGKLPNKLLVGFDVWMALKRHPKIVDRIKHTSKEPVTEQLVASLFGLQQIVVCQSAKATNPVGQAETYDFVHGKHALLAYVGMNGEGDFMPSAGRIFAWKGLNPGGVGPAQAISVEVIDKPLHKAVRYEVETNWDAKITGQKLATFFITAVA